MINFACFYVTEALQVINYFLITFQYQINEAAGLGALIAYHGVLFIN